MRARWVLPNPLPELPTVGAAIIARWWPGKYFLVSTIQMDGTSLEERMFRNLQDGTEIDDPAPVLSRFITQVFHCDANGMVSDFFSPLYQVEHPNLAIAQVGHKQTVERVAQGKLRNIQRQCC